MGLAKGFVQDSAQIVHMSVTMICSETFMLTVTDDFAMV